MIDLLQGCRAYLCVMDVLLLLVGVAVQIGAIMLLLEDPVMSFSDLPGSFSSKVFLFLGGTLTMVASCVGFRFWAKPRRRAAGICYLLIIVLNLALLTFALYLFFYSARLIKDLDCDGDAACHPKVEPPIREALAKTFQSFATRFQRDECSIPTPKSLSADGPGSGEVLPWTDRRLAGTCPQAELTCRDDAPVKVFSTKYCQPKDGSEAQYNSKCGTCLNEYYEDFIANTTMERKYMNDPQNFTALWNSDAKLAFCRCYGRALDSFSRYEAGIGTGVFIYFALQVLLLFGVIYLICFPPRDPLYDPYMDDATEMAAGRWS